MNPLPPSLQPASERTPMPWRWRLARGVALIAIAVLLALAVALPEREARGDSPVQVPRFMSVKASPANVRRGPGSDHEILWVFRHPGLPVEVIAEHQDWRRIRDWDGDEGWVYQALLTSRRSVIVVGGDATLHSAPETGAPAIAIAQPGVVASLLACTGDWCEVDAAGHDGWVVRTAIWGVYPEEVIGR
ncbi:MAG: SH3 domain-containing protein [Alphaproteobacteria bacterium]